MSKYSSTGLYGVAEDVGYTLLILMAIPFIAAFLDAIRQLIAIHIHLDGAIYVILALLLVLYLAVQIAVLIIPFLLVRFGIKEYGIWKTAAITVIVTVLLFGLRHAVTLDRYKTNLGEETITAMTQAEIRAGYFRTESVWAAARDGVLRKAETIREAKKIEDTTEKATYLFNRFFDGFKRNVKNVNSTGNYITSKLFPELKKS